MLHFDRNSFVACLVALSAGLTLAQTANADDPTIHAAWDGEGEPMEDQDYFLTPGEFPEIELTTARTDWRVWATDPDNGGDPGDIGRIWTDSTGTFAVRILDDSDDAGARDVNEIDLQPSGNSSVLDSHITGDLGDTTLKGFTSLGIHVEGDVIGDVVSEGDMCIQVDGDVTSAGSIFAEQLDSGCGGGAGVISIDGELAGSIVIDGPVRGAFVRSYIQIDGDITSTGSVTVATVEYTEAFDPDQPYISVGDDCDGTISVGRLEQECTISVAGELGGKIIGTSEGAFDNDFDGVVTIGDGGSGKIEARALALLSNPPAHGTIDIDGVFTGSVLLGWLNGTVEIETLGDGGVVGGPSWASGRVYELSSGYSLDIEVDFQSGAEIKVNTLDGEINVTQTSEVAGGDITIATDMSGDITIDGDYNGDLTVSATGGAESGSSIVITGKLKNAGDIEIYGDADGLIDIGDRLSGTVFIDGDFNSTQAMSVGEQMHGQISIGGLCKRQINVAEKLATGAVIRAIEGLDDNGKILINTSQGNFDAEGTIYIGPEATDGPVVYDGCIRVYDNGSSSYGNLSGSIIVNGCHDPADELNICIDGTYSGTSIQIVESTCSSYVPGFDCNGCP